ncbi:MAG TPA: alpha/beta hydrolase [Burkholderiales bacterium]|nr:alpha/beta hydrolase [Burkholderiales bacterium]
MSRRLCICLSIVAGIAYGLLNLKELPLLTESIEQRLVFDPIPVDSKLLRAVPSLAEGVEEVHLAMPDGVVLHGWLKRPDRLRPGERYPLVIVYGGVRREISEFVQEARGPGRWGWLMVNYRGFGLSGGVPTERAVLEDSKRVYDWAASQPDVDATNIVLLGRSLGSYVAVTVAAARRARATILATPFDSAVALGEKRFPHLPVRWLVGSRFDPASLAPSISVPALFVLAENDEITPAENGRALAQKWGGLKELVMLRGATHSGIEAREEFWGSVATFLKGISSPALAVSAAATVSSQGPSRGR